jgi:uncharacterized Fe-S center protein
VYGTQQVQLLEAHFEQFLDHIGCDKAQLQQEWVQVKAHLGNRRVNNIIPKINSLFTIDGDRFKNILSHWCQRFVLPVKQLLLGHLGFQVDQ